MAFWAFVLFVVCSMQYALQSCNTSRSCSKCYKSAAGLFVLGFWNFVMHHLFCVCGFQSTWVCWKSLATHPPMYLSPCAPSIPGAMKFVLTRSQPVHQILQASSSRCREFGESSCARGPSGSHPDGSTWRRDFVTYLGIAIPLMSRVYP